MGFYDQIQMLCKEQHVSVRELERSCEFAQGTLKRWNSVVPGVDKLIRVADQLQVSLDELCGRENPSDVDIMPIVESYMKDYNTMSEEENMLLMSFRTLSDSDKLAVMSLILKMRLKKGDDKNE